MAGLLPPALGLLGLVVWTAVLYAERRAFAAHSPLPIAVRDAAVVGLYAAMAGGLAASLGFGDYISSELSASLAAAWRAAVLAAGVYALIGSRRARGR